MVSFFRQDEHCEREEGREVSSTIRFDATEVPKNHLEVFFLPISPRSSFSGINLVMTENVLPLKQKEEGRNRGQNRLDEERGKAD